MVHAPFEIGVAETTPLKLLLMGKPICIRYSAEYAARIATGGWRAKKHKAFAAEARHAWATLKKMNGGKAWIRHARRHGLAHELADSGKHGARVYAEDVN